MKRLIGIGIPLLAAAVFVTLLVWWLGATTGQAVALRSPHMLSVDRPEGVATTTDAPDPSDDQEPDAKTRPNARGTVTRGDGEAPNEFDGIWPEFRGPDRDAVSPQDVALADSWGPDGPPLLWERKLGEGHAGAAVWKGRVFVLDYDNESKSDVYRCMSLADGEDIWTYRYPVNVRKNHGLSRTIPATDGEYVVGLGPKAHVTCLRAENGELVWAKDLAAQFGTKVPTWYAGQCPIIEDGKVILAPAGPDVLLMAVDLASGEILWQADNAMGWKMTHSSVAAIEIDGVKQYVYEGSGGVAGIAPGGEILWTNTDWTVSIANVAAPMHLGEGRLLLTGGYQAGAMLLQVAQSGEEWTAEVIRHMPDTHFGSDQQTPIFYEGYIYGVQPKPSMQLVCLDRDGEVVWSSGTQHTFGYGPFTIADGKIYIMDDHAHLTVARATSDGYEQLDHHELFAGRDSWAPMAIVDGRVLLRDHQTFQCRDLRPQD